MQLKQSVRQDACTHADSWACKDMPSAQRMQGKHVVQTRAQQVDSKGVGITSWACTTAMTAFEAATWHLVLLNSLSRLACLRLHMDDVGTDWAVRAAQRGYELQALTLACCKAAHSAALQQHAQPAQLPLSARTA